MKSTGRRGADFLRRRGGIDEFRKAFLDGVEALAQRVIFGIGHAGRIVLIVAPVVHLEFQREPHVLDFRLGLGEVGDVGELFGFGFCYHAGSLGSSFRDGPKDQTRNLEISWRCARPGMTDWLEQSATIMAYYVYILASRRDGATYVGMTNDLVRRVFEHRQKAIPGFTSKYNIARTRMVRNLRGPHLRDFPRKRAEEVEAELEDLAYRS